MALNFVVSFLYNKLPRRLVNIFGEELERALRCKFQTHWYPEQPSRGSAYRCLRTGHPADTVLDTAARESGLAAAEVRESLPTDLCVWIDPGEVSYRIGERGHIRVIYSAASSVDPSGAALGVGASGVPDSCDWEVDSVMDGHMQGSAVSDAGIVSPEIDELATAVANALAVGAESRCDDPIEAATVAELSTTNSSSAGSVCGTALFSPLPPAQHHSMHQLPPLGDLCSSPPTGSSFWQQQPQQLRRPTQPLTFTAAMFAQTKFGSTKLKTAGKRNSRMSPTEFSQYIKQRAIQQQQQQQLHRQRQLYPSHNPNQQQQHQHLQQQPQQLSAHHHPYYHNHPHQQPQHPHFSQYNTGNTAVPQQQMGAGLAHISSGHHYYTGSSRVVDPLVFPPPSSVDPAGPSLSSSSSVAAPVLPPPNTKETSSLKYFHRPNQQQQQQQQNGSDAAILGDVYDPLLGNSCIPLLGESAMVKTAGSLPLSAAETDMEQQQQQQQLQEEEQLLLEELQYTSSQLQQLMVAN